MSAAFSRAKAMMSLIAAAAAAGTVFSGQYVYVSRGHGEGCRGNKHAKSSFKQNKRRGL